MSSGGNRMMHAQLDPGDSESAPSSRQCSTSTHTMELSTPPRWSSGGFHVKQNSGYVSISSHSPKTNQWENIN